MDSEILSLHLGRKEVLKAILGNSEEQHSIGVGHPIGYPQHAYIVLGATPREGRVIPDSIEIDGIQVEIRQTLNFCR